METTISNHSKKRKLEERNPDSESEEEEENEGQQTYKFERKKVITRKDCPYLDTIKRELLDFDFEKLCSVTLQNLNVYACLVCGKYFQGRGKNSPAYTHSLQALHNVFINLHDEKIYCLPDDYEVLDPSLSDIQSVLNPKYTPEQIKNFDIKSQISQALDGTEYIPGFIGLNNNSHTDYLNVIVQSLAHVPPIRNFFCEPNNYIHLTKDPVVLKFGELIRKMWHNNNYKGQVDPHEFLQAVSNASEKKFKSGVTRDPLDFLQFLLNHLHIHLGGTKKAGSSIIYQTFQGELEAVIEKFRDPAEKKPDRSKGENIENVTTQIVPFLLLSLDIPPPPLFVDEMEKNIIPQVPIFNLLAKFDGDTETFNNLKKEAKTFIITKLPPYLILHAKRFTKNNWFQEKNPTIINFPLKFLDFKPYLKGWSKNPFQPTKYNLITNLCHEGEPEKGTYRVHVLNKAKLVWYEIQDLMVKEILPQLITLSEIYIQIWEREDVAK